MLLNVFYVRFKFIIVSFVHSRKTVLFIVDITLHNLKIFHTKKHTHHFKTVKTNFIQIFHKPFSIIFINVSICDVLLFIAISSQYQYLWMEEDALGNRNSARNSICSQQIGYTKSLLVPDLNNMSNNTRRHSSISHKIVIEFVTAHFDNFSFVLMNFFCVCFCHQCYLIPFSCCI